ncbi:MAG: hypothetical protein ABRQ37_18975 [Candidatus Eremiobacterota bacterium]
MYRIENIFRVITVIFIVMFCFHRTEAFDRNFIYNYQSKKDIKNNQIKENISPVSDRPVINPNSPMELYNDAFQHLRFKKEVFPLKSASLSDVMSVFPYMNTGSVKNITFKNHTDGTISMDFKQLVTEKSFMKCYLEPSNVDGTFSGTMNYVYNISDKTRSTVDINIDGDNNSAGTFGLYHNLGWSSIDMAYTCDNSEMSGNFDFLWKQKKIAIPGTPVLFSLSAGLNRDGDGLWGKKTKLSLSHSPVTFGESGMLQFTCSGEMNWGEYESHKMTGIMTLSFSDSLSLYASVFSKETDFDYATTVNTSGNIGLEVGITENLKGEIFYSFMGYDTRIDDISADYMGSHELTGQFSYSFSEGSEIALEMNYNIDEGKINSLSTGLNLNTGDNQFLRIRPSYDFQYSEVSIQLETVLIR